LLVVGGLVWLDETRLLVGRRPANARFGAGLLELPGGKVEPGEAPAAALRRELVEEWGPDAALLRVGDIVDLLHHVYPPPGPEVVLAVYDVDAAAWRDGWEARVVVEPGAAVCCFAAAELPVTGFLPADRDFVARIRDRGPRGGPGLAPC
jgi:8-oxo-dGTP diphosphatase